MIKETLTKLSTSQSLKSEEVESFVSQVIAGVVSDSQVAAFLMGLRAKGETPDELAGCVRELRRHAITVPHNQSLVFDCCGTGGDGSHSFNVSTAAAFVMASCGVPVAKHGNRAVSSSCGSADILEAAGAKIEVSPNTSAKMLDQLGFCFLFAPVYHPAMRKVAQVRRDLGIKTLFNLVGPLLNPAYATHQAIGASSAENARLLIETLAQLSQKEVTSFSNSLGMDEVLPSGENIAYRISDSVIKQETLEIPPSLRNGFVPHDIRGGDRETNLSILRNVLSGAESIYAQVTALNAALGLVIVGLAASMSDGYERAVAELKSLRVDALFNNYVAFSNEVS